MTDAILKGLGLFLVAFVVLLILASFIALPLMWLWNWLMPVLFGLKTIGYLQALGLMLLANILFKGVSVSSK